MFRYFPLVSRSTGFEGLDLSMISGIGIKVNYAGGVHVVWEGPQDPGVCPT